MSRARWRAGEGVIPLSVVAVSVVELLVVPGVAGRSPVTFLLVTAAGAGVLVLRRQRPLLVLAVVALLAAGAGLTGVSARSAGQALVLMIAILACGRHASRPAAYLAAPGGVVATGPLAHSAGSWWWLLAPVGAFALGAWTRLKEQLAQSRRAEAEQRVRAGIAEERWRVAQERHDVLVERHRRGGQTRSWVREVEAFVADAAAAGLPVVLDTNVAGRLPTPVASAVYGVVQESLSNVLRHAGRVPTRVEISDAEGCVLVRVLDDGGRTGVDIAAVEAGHGLLGLRERVEAVGGRLWTAVRPQGGFEVLAELPPAEDPW